MIGNWNVHNIFIYVFCHALISCLPYHYSIRFLFSLKAGYRRVGDSFVSGGTVSCHCDDLCHHRWRRGGRLDDLLFSLLE